MLQIEKELDHLNQMLLKMADLVQKNITDALDVFRHHKNDIFINDEIIDKYETLIEEICINILLKERLYAKDLRKVTGILKMIVDLERIGDHAEDIMRYNHKFISCREGDKACLNLDPIIALTSSMVTDAILSFVNEDMELANEVIARDDKVDDMYDAYAQMLIDMLEEKNLASSIAIYTIIVLKYIERISDHAVNIAEWVIYIISGHHKDKQIF